MGYGKLWFGLWVVIGVSFAVLGYYGREIYRQAPPIPEQVVTEQGDVLFTGQDIRDGQNVWQSLGGQELGSIWGHGAYVAPDWSADWLHRECLWLLRHWSEKEFGKSYETLAAPQQAELRALLREAIRTNTYDATSDTIAVSSDRAAAINAVGRYYAVILGDAEEFPPDVADLADGGMTPTQLRHAYAVAKRTVRDPERQRQLNAFIFWTAWACGTERPVESAAVPATRMTPAIPSVTYTNNWPAEPLINNRPSGAIVIWSVISFVLLLAGIGALAWYYAALKNREDEPSSLPTSDPLLGLRPTPSMQATLKYFWVVAALIVVQIGFGAVTAHYGVEGEGFYGIPLANWLPYSVTRTWHTQLAIFWIATAWLATGLFIAPAVSGHEPKYQRAGVNFLFVCLVVIVGGSLFGTWFATRQRMGAADEFLVRAPGVRIRRPGTLLAGISSGGVVPLADADGSGVGPGIPQEGREQAPSRFVRRSIGGNRTLLRRGTMWGRQTNLAIAEYWRWWVVHLWVEGFFEVFATVVIAFLFTRMGLLRTSTASAAVIFSSTIFLSGGIIGTFHHLYFTGTPTAILALGATFSALEVVPLVLIGFEAYENLTLSRARPWVRAYKWPIYFFVAVAFWNLVGAGLFGFLINPPIALYYMQGLNTTPVHGHTALFGVYGLLGMGLLLFCLKGLATHNAWRTGVLSFSFWAINIGLALMVLLSLLPVGLAQTWASVEHGLWYARTRRIPAE